MYRVLKKEKVADNTYLIQINAPKIAKKIQAGEFIVLQLDEFSEKIPLTVIDNTKTTLSVIFLVAGNTTKKLSKLKKKSEIYSITGPLGNPIEINEYGTVCVVAGGLGLTTAYPIAKAFKEFNKVVAIVGAKNKKNLFYLDEFKKVCDSFIICTEDGSYGMKGNVVDALKKLMKREYLNIVFSIGPVDMMKTISDYTKSRVKVIACLNPIIIDGIGMCGSCRVTVNNETKFACVDGPHFDSHMINWNEFMRRNSRYKKQEKHICRIRK
jgi:ferredoxin--NADP+ reductase